jgi:hypothetical protein
MTKRLHKWATPLVGIALGLVLAVVELVRTSSAALAVAVLAIMAAYSLVLVLLRARSETVSLLSGLAVDERWESINRRALASTAEVMAIVLVGAFIGVEATGGDATPYSWTAAVLGVSYVVGITWYRWRS